MVKKKLLVLMLMRVMRERNDQSLLVLDDGKRKRSMNRLFYDKRIETERCSFICEEMKRRRKVGKYFGK
jgi:hypothetical protein